MAPPDPISASITPVAIPDYLTRVYDWAYVTPEAVKRFERQWLVNLILWGNFARLRDEALRTLGTNLDGRTLQVACVYGDLTARLLDAHSTHGRLDVIDVLPVQTDNLRRKLGNRASRIGIDLGNSAAMPYANASYDRALLFFLLHEQPEDVRRQTIEEALRVVRPGGTLVIVDYHRPSPWHPLYWPMNAVLRSLEPFAMDLWAQPVTDWFPAGAVVSAGRKQTYFGGLYQLLEIRRGA